MQSARTWRWVLWLPALLSVCAGCGAGTSRSTPRPSVAQPSHVVPSSGASTAGGPVDRSAFSRGACVAFSPASSGRPRTVFLDAGHGGRDPGAVGSNRSGQTIHEADATLPVELDTMALLRAKGFRVVVSRTRDSSVVRLRPADVAGGVLTVAGSHHDVLARALCADKARASLLVGIYFNAGGQGSAGSVTVYDAVRPFASSSLRLAKLVQADVVAALDARGWNIPNGGVHPDNGFGSVLSAQGHAYGHLVLLGPADPGYVSTPSQMPGALIEPLFLTDRFEASVASSRPGQRAMASGLARAVEQYFAAPSTPPPQPQRPNRRPAHRALRGQIPTRLPTRQRVVALTFDAGADAAGAPKILAALRQDRTTATFFMTGRWAQLYPSWAKRIAAQYPVGNHTYNHRDLLSLPLSSVSHEMLMAGAAIRHTTGRHRHPPVSPSVRLEQHQRARGRQPARLHGRRLDGRHARLGGNGPGTVTRLCHLARPLTWSPARSFSCTSAPTLRITPA